MDTVKLYDDAPLLFDFDARVVGIKKENKKTAVVLDRTAFFPEGGGQPGDIGMLGGARVVDTQIKNGEILHFCEKDPGFAVGSGVRGAVDREVRFARMQAHSGEHIVSGLAHNLYGANNVGFHMDGTLMTVDFDLPLGREALDKIEEEANACVYRNVPIRAWYPNDETLLTLEYRSKNEIEGRVRIVTVEGVDQCACCAVHVPFSGMIGLIKLLTCVSHRGGVRITLICGVTAWRDYCAKHTQTLRIAAMLAAKHNETDVAVEKLLEKEKALRYRLGQRTQQAADLAADAAEGRGENLLVNVPGLSPEECKTAAMRLKDRCGGICAVISGDDCKGYSFAMTSSTVKVTDFTKEVLTALHGNGGGRYDAVMGRFNAKYEEIDRFFSGYSVNAL